MLNTGLEGRAYVKCSYHTHKLIKEVGGDLGDGYVCGPDDGNGFVGVYLPQTCQVIHVKYVHLFKCQSHLNKVFFFFNLSEEKNFWSPGIVVLDRLNTKYINMKYTL